jgi:N utilization substance protein B
MSKPSAKARRSAARLAAVQALYQMAVAGAGVEAVLGEFARHRFGADLDGERYVAPDPPLFAMIVRGVTERAADVDRLVAGALMPPWAADRLELILRIILRAGAWELLANREVPGRIVITEYVDVAHAFFGGREPGLVNAVLDRLGRALRPEGEADGGAAAG